jgi:hypothetical protein
MAWTLLLSTMSPWSSVHSRVMTGSQMSHWLTR